MILLLMKKKRQNCKKEKWCFKFDLVSIEFIDLLKMNQ